MDSKAPATVHTSAASSINSHSTYRFTLHSMWLGALQWRREEEKCRCLIWLAFSKLFVFRSLPVLLKRCWFSLCGKLLGFLRRSFRLAANHDVLGGTSVQNMLSLTPSPPVVVVVIRAMCHPTCPRLHWQRIQKCSECQTKNPIPFGSHNPFWLRATSSRHDPMLATQDKLLWRTYILAFQEWPPLFWMNEWIDVWAHV